MRTIREFLDNKYAKRELYANQVIILFIKETWGQRKASETINAQPQIEPINIAIDSFLSITRNDISKRDIDINVITRSCNLLICDLKFRKLSPMTYIGTYMSNLKSTISLKQRKLIAVNKTKIQSTLNFHFTPILTSGVIPYRKKHILMNHKVFIGEAVNKETPNRASITCFKSAYPMIYMVTPERRNNGYSRINRLL